MSKNMRLKTSVAALFAIYLAATPAHAFDIVATASSAAALEGVRGLVNGSIDKAQNAGDFLVFKTATELKVAIDSWEKANKAILDKAFKDLNESQRKFISDVNSAATKLEGSGTALMESVKEVGELWNQTLADAKIYDGSLALFRYAPRVAHPGMSGEVSFTVRGVNFDKNDPQLILPNGKAAKRTSLTKQEAVYLIPSNTFSFQESRQQTAQLHLDYFAPSPGAFGWIKDAINGRSERVRTEISVMQLPKKLAEYSFAQSTKEVAVDTWQGSREFHFSGRDDQKSFNQSPHDNDWRFNMGSLKIDRVWGEAGRGCHVMTNNQHGFQIEVRVGVIKSFPNIYGPGYQHCIYSWTEFKERTVVVDQPSKQGVFGWMEDVTLPVAANKAKYQLQVRTWDGKAKTHLGSATDPFYEIIEASDTIVLRPRIPAWINGL